MNIDLSDVVQVAQIAKELGVSPAKAQTICNNSKSEVRIGRAKFYSRTAVRAHLLGENEGMLRFLGLWSVQAEQ